MGTLEKRTGLAVAAGYPIYIMSGVILLGHSDVQNPTGGFVGRVVGRLDIMIINIKIGLYKMKE